MKRGVCIIFGFFFLQTIVTGCYNCGDSTEYNIVVYKLSLIKGTDADGSVIFSHENTLIPNEEVSYQKFGIALMLETSVAQAMPAAVLFNNAYACDPLHTPKQYVTSFDITSDAPFITSNKTFNPGEILNEIFGTFTPFEVTPLKERDPARFSYNASTLVLLESGIDNQRHEFTINIKLDDGRSFSLKSTPVTLIK